MPKEEEYRIRANPVARTGVAPDWDAKKNFVAVSDSDVFPVEKLGIMKDFPFGSWPHLQIGKANERLFICGINDSEHYGTWYPLKEESSAVQKSVKEYLAKEDS